MDTQMVTYTRQSARIRLIEAMLSNPNYNVAAVTTLTPNSKKTEAERLVSVATAIFEELQRTDK